MEKLLKKYNTLIKKLNDVNDDNESGHMFQDEIYRKFIKDISTNKFDKIEDIKEIAKLLNKHVISKDVDRWYS
jgi:hypothetical protein